MPHRRERAIRGYRPIHFGLPSEEEFDTLHLLTEEKIEFYAARVSAGLPVFPEDEAAPLVPAAPLAPAGAAHDTAPASA